VKRRFLIVVTLIVIAGAFLFTVSAQNSGASHSQAAKRSSEGTRDSKVVAYYFHGNTRCFTCRKIESLSHDVVTSEFSFQLKADQLEWQSVNFEQPGNGHLFEDYKLVTSSLVLVTYKNGKQTDYRNLTNVWKLVKNELTFRSYVKSGIQAALDRIQ
jgi:hypothetical protein